MKGVKNSFSKYIVFLDCDVSVSQKDLRKLIINRGEKLMLIGSRYTKGGKVMGADKTKVFLSKILNFTVSLIYNLKISDLSHSLRIFPNVIDFNNIKTYSHPGFFWEITLIFKKNGIVNEMPITFNERVYGITKNKTKKLIYSVMSFFINKIKFK